MKIDNAPNTVLISGGTQGLSLARHLLAKQAAGSMDTPAEAEIQKRFHGADDDWVEKAEAGMPMGQLAKPAQLVPLIAYLLSPSSGIITGATIDYDQQIIGAVSE
ncbi:SDR family oxidoreductase [Candidatus Puniceispirillum sp.]|uniref:SDR family oxidoreductase n=1 Tax=Candidatus Puniceispirillum sp. TaxID=2026719 RepID=UPI003F697124